MRSFNVGIVHIAFLFSLIFHIAILSMNINVDRPDAMPIEIFKIRYSPQVEERRQIKEIDMVKAPEKKQREKPKEIPKETPVKIPEETTKEIATEIPKKITTETPKHNEMLNEPVEEITATVAAEAKKMPEISKSPGKTVKEATAQTVVSPEAMLEIKEISPEIDFTWIAKELRNRIEAIKSYPRIARRMGIEGTVVMTVKFNKMGELVDVHIKESAGHRILDRDAISLVKRVSPLRHGTGRNIVIELPISYNLIEQ